MGGSGWWSLGPMVWAVAGATAKWMTEGLLLSILISEGCSILAMVTTLGIRPLVGGARAQAVSPMKGLLPKKNVIFPVWFPSSRQKDLPFILGFNQDFV